MDDVERLDVVMSTMVRRGAPVRLREHLAACAGVDIPTPAIDEPHLSTPVAREARSCEEWNKIAAGDSTTSSTSGIPLTEPVSSS